MLVKINNPVGPSLAIDKLQEELESTLFAKWGLDLGDPSFVFYPLIYKNQAPAPASGFIAELYTGDGNYEEVYLNDAIKGHAFFGLGSRTTVGAENMVDVHLVCFANLEALYPAIDHRADVEIRRDFEKALEGFIYGFKLQSIETGLANVLKEYNGSRRDDRLLQADLGSFHAFRLNLVLTYDPDFC